MRERFLLVLGLSQAASADEIKKAFKDLAFRYHPDRNPSNPASEKQFRAVAEAYAYLSENREMLAAIQSENFSTSRSSKIFEDFYQEFFGIAAEQMRPFGKNLYEMVTLDLEEAFRGCTRQLSVWREYPCGSCAGRGAPAGIASATCTYCFGRGFVKVPQSGVKVQKGCPNCRGLGRLPAEPCLKCQGRGFLARKEIVSVTIPPKVQHGAELRFTGLGSLAPPQTDLLGAGTLVNSSSELSPKNGDLIVHVEIRPHPTFRFDGPDLLCEARISLPVARQGGVVWVQTLSGAQKIEVPAGVMPNTIVPLKGLGLGGDLLVEIVLDDGKPPQTLNPVSRKPLGVFGQLSRRLKRLFKNQSSI